MGADSMVLRLPAVGLILVFAAVLASIFAWSSPSGVARALASSETLFAIGLSLATALAAAGLALVLGVPVAFAFLAANIAGIFNHSRTVLGLMPHPERAVDPAHGGTDGVAMFEGLVAALAR